MAIAAAIDPTKAPHVALRTERDRFAALAFCWADVLLELDAGAKVIYAAGATRPLMGLDAGELVGRSLAAIVAPADRHLVAKILGIARDRGRIEHMSVRLLAAAGSTRPLAVAGYRLEDIDGHYFLALRSEGVCKLDAGDDLTRDEGTGLYDGDSFVSMVTRHLSDSISGAERRMTLIALPGYDDLQQRLGEGEERSLLADVGACLGSGAVDGDAAGRLGTDRFGLVHHLGLDVARLQAQIAELTRRADPAAMGIAVESATIDLDADPGNEEQIASGLLFTINRFRRSKGSEFTLSSLSGSLKALAAQTIDAIADFKRLIAAADFEIAFQPIVSVKSGSIHHYEALVRFPARYGARSTYEHILFAEEAALISDFDLAMTDKVLQWLKTKTPVNAKTCLAVNLSGQSIGSASFVTRLDALLKEHPWSRGRLMFEITESAKIGDLKAVNASIRRLREQGYPICLDDFGAGAANFEYLTTLEVDIIKFDGPALRTARQAAKGNAFLKAFVGLCRDLGIATVAEMIDDEAGLRFVRSCGVQYVQGYLFGKPATDIRVFRNGAGTSASPRAVGAAR